ncbi:MAG: CapA family protein [Cyclobacteriaceae bacterium]|nr:CapA family protein [Cyclobacteriaceae bacterium]
MRSILLLAIIFGLLTTVSAQSKKDTVTLIGVGDMMMGSNYPNGGKLPPDDGRGLMKEVEPVLQNADVTFGNLEGVLLNEGGIAKTCRDPKVCYVFRSPEKYVQNLVNAGFDVMSLANNHSGDFGDMGKRSSIRALEGAGIYQAGQTNKPYVVFERNGVKYGMAAFAPNTGCPSINDLTEAKRIIRKLDSLVDVVIVSFHGGAEGPQHEHVPRKNEPFHGENRGNVYQFAHQLIDVGADVIFGHGPHVTRAVEVYKDRFIAYSMGNFCTYGGINVSGINGLAPIVKVFTSSTGKFYKAHITSIKQSFYGPVAIDPEKRVLKRIQLLTQQDFPECKIEIDDLGWVRSKTK